jgi:hypothetical protein
MLEWVVLSNTMRKNKASRKLTTKQEKINYVTASKRKDKHLLDTGGLAVAKGVPLVSLLKFFSVIFFSTSI